MKALWIAGLLTSTAAAVSVAAPPPPDSAACDREVRAPGGPYGLFPGMPVGSGEDLAPVFADELMLTEAQQDKLFDILHAAAPTLRAQEKAVRKAGDALYSFGRSAKFDNGTAIALSQALAKADGDLMLLQAQIDHDIFAVLTPEQRARFSGSPRGREKRPGDTPHPSE